MRKGLYAFFLACLVVGAFFLFGSPSTNSRLHNLQTQVEQLEQRAETSTLTAEDLNTLSALKATVTDLQTLTTDLPPTTATQLTDLTERIVALEGDSGATGPAGAKGATGAIGPTGATGATGPQGTPGSNDCIGGICVSRQTSTPGVAETGNINITGTAIATLFSGSGASLTSLNGSNISSGTVADARLSTLVTLQGNSFNGVSQLVQTTAGGILPVLSGANLTSLTGANVTGNISGNAGTATALAANPTDCAANTYATTIAASGNLTCASTTDGSLSANVTLQGNSFNGVNQLVQLTAGGILPILNGSNLTNLSQSQITNLTTDLSNKQPLDSELTAIAGLTSAADKLPYFTGSGAAAVTDFSSLARTYIASAGRAGVVLTDSTQSITTATSSSVVWDTEVSDTDGWFPGAGNTTVTVPSGKGGRYLVSYTAQWSSSGLGTNPGIGITINGTQTYGASGTTPYGQHTVTFLRTLAASDTILVAVFQNSGGSVNVTSRLEIAWVGP